MKTRNDKIFKAAEGNGSIFKEADGNGLIFKAADASRSSASHADADNSVGQGKLYAPPSSAVAAANDHTDSKRKHVADFHTGVDDVYNPDSYSGGREASLKRTVEKAMAKVKSSLPSESLDKALHVILDAFRDAQSSTKEAVQRVKDRLSAILPASHHSDVETIVDDVERQMLSKSEAPEIASKL